MNQSGCGLGVKFGPNQAQYYEESKGTGGIHFKAKSSGCTNN